EVPMTDERRRHEQHETRAQRRQRQRAETRAHRHQQAVEAVEQAKQFHDRLGRDEPDPGWTLREWVIARAFARLVEERLDNDPGRAPGVVSIPDDLAFGRQVSSAVGESAGEPIGLDEVEAVALKLQDEGLLMELPAESTASESFLQTIRNPAVRRAATKGGWDEKRAQVAEALMRLLNETADRDPDDPRPLVYVERGETMWVWAGDDKPQHG